LGDQIKKDEMDRACSKYGGEEKSIQGFGGVILVKETTWETRCRRKDNIKMDLKEVGWGGMDWIELAQDRDNWQACVNVVMNLQIP